MKPRLLSLLRQPTAYTSSPIRPSVPLRNTAPSPHISPHFRCFSSTPSTANWLFPKRGHKVKSRKGRPRVPTGGSVRGTTIVWGDYGLRMTDHDRRISAKQLSIGAETIKKRLRGERYKLFMRVCANIGVYTSGNEVRMGKGKGTFDYWASRVAVSKIIFEIKGEMHEKVIRDALRLAAAKMPGQYEFVRKGDPPVMGITKMTEGMNLENMQRPRMPTPSLVSTADRLPATSAP
ncbi:MAG: mitochondrial ribosomal large subunit component [Stictis urceolatum]|nr:mitochondrial ribosomal large subunit component [Stictis urceolata]